MNLYVLKYPGRFTTEAQYGDIVLRATKDGEILRLKDPSKAIDPKDYNDENTVKEKIEYDYLKLEIQNSK